MPQPLNQDPSTGSAGGLDEAQRLLDESPGAALSLALSALNVVAAVAHGRDEARGHFLVGAAERRLARFGAAAEHLECARRLYEAAGDLSGELDVLLELNRAHRATGNVDAAGECLHRAITLSVSTGRRDAEAAALNGLAGVAHTLGDRDTALEHLQRSLEIRRGIGDARGEIDCLNNIGILNTDRGQYAAALEALTSCLDLIRAHSAGAEAEANCLINVGIVHQDMRRFDAATDCFQSALGLAHASGSKDVEALALLNLAETRTLEGAHVEAVRLYEDVIEAARAMGQTPTEIAALEGRARANIGRGRRAEAAADVERALDMCRAVGDRDQEVKLLLDLADVREASDRTAARRALEDALAVAATIGSKKLLRDCEQRLAGLLETAGQHRAALERYKRAFQLERETFTEEHNRSLQSVTARFELERAHAEAAAYRERTEEAQRLAERLEELVQERTQELVRAQLETVARLAVAAEYRDDQTGNHTLRVGELSAAVARELGFGESDVDDIREAARLHDVGKIGIPDAILLKAGKLTPDEFEQMKVHAATGAEILTGGSSEILRKAREIAESHHERWDGTGYPHGLSGESIPILGRIVAVADVFDALISERPYKLAWTEAEALAEITRQSGRMFDPGVVEAFTRTMAKRLFGLEPAVAGEECPSTARPAVTQAAEGATTRDGAASSVDRTLLGLVRDALSGTARPELDAAIADAWEVRACDPDRSLRLSEAALSASQAQAYRRGIGYARRNLGFVHFANARYEDAIDQLLEALEVGRALQDHVLTRDCLNWLGAVHSSLGSYTEGIEYVEQTLQLNRRAEDRSGTASSLTNLGILYQHLGRNDEAVPLHEESVALSRELGDGSREARGLNNLGSSLNATGRHEAAVHHLQNALRLAARLGEQDLQSRVLVNLCDSYLASGDIAAALEASDRALTVVEGTGHREAAAHAYLTAGHAHLAASDTPHAITSYSAALSVAVEIGSKAVQGEVHLHLSRAHWAYGDAAKAYRHLELHHNLDRELRAEAADRRARVASAQREIERARVESEIYRLRNVELARALASAQEADRRKAELVRELEQKSGELERQARVDGLTGVYNRRHLETLLAAEFEACRRAGRPLSVAMIDVDHFKDVNDRYSHAVGDQVLARLALMLQESCGDRGIVARYGGEEFAVALPGLSAAEAAVVCERLRHAVETERRHWVRAHPDLRVTISVGVADDPSAPDHEKLLGAADAKLYEAKRAGRNRVRG